MVAVWIWPFLPQPRWTSPRGSKSTRDSCIPCSWKRWVLQLKKFQVQSWSLPRRVLCGEQGCLRTLTCAWYADNILAEARHVGVHRGLTGARSLGAERSWSDNCYILKATNNWNAQQDRQVKGLQNKVLIDCDLVPRLIPVLVSQRRATFRDDYKQQRYQTIIINTELQVSLWQWTPSSCIPSHGEITVLQLASARGVEITGTSDWLAPERNDWSTLRNISMQYN